MSKKLITYSALAVGGFLAYRYLFAEQVVQANFLGYSIVKKAGFFFAKDIAGSIVTDGMADMTAVQAWITAQSAKNAAASMIPGMGGDDVMLVAPPGETISSSGQVLGALGYDAYDAAPYQYSREVINDLGDLGWGGGFKKAVSKVSKSVSKVVKPVVKAVTSVPKVVSSVINAPLVQKVLNVTSTMTMIPMATRLGMSTLKIGFKAMTNPKGAFKSVVGGVKSFTITPLMQTGMVLGIVKPPKPPQEGPGGTIYQDANDNTITKEEYDTLLAAAQTSSPAKAEDYKGYALWTYKKPDGSGALYLINYDPSQNACEGAYSTMAEAKAAIDAVVVPIAQVASPSMAKVTYYKGHFIGDRPQTTAKEPSHSVDGGPFIYYGIGSAMAAIDRLLIKEAAPSTNVVEVYKNNTINSVTDSSGTYFNVNGGDIHYGTIEVARAAIDATIPKSAPVSTFNFGPPGTSSNPYSYAAQTSPSQPSSYDASNDRLGPTQNQDYGTPALPERITQVSTPSAQYVAPVPQYEAPVEPKKSGNAAVGVMVGGGLLATALMFLKK